MDVDIVGEDPVTQAILMKLIGEIRPDIVIGRVLPVRGGQIKKLSPNYNLLGSPIILLTDLDFEDCAPSLIRNWLKNQPLSDTMLFRVACEEAETWLMADREGFARWLSIDIDLIPLPTPINRRMPLLELRFPMKPSLFLMRNLASVSKKQKLKEDLMPRDGASKGPGYNAAIKPFIENQWDIENAARNSDSLSRAIRSLRNFNPVYDDTI